MTDPATLEIAARGVAVGAFAATGIALAASRRLTPARWLGVLLFACAIAHVLESYSNLTFDRHVNVLTWAMSALTGSVFWLFSAVLFEDEPRIPPWRFAIPGVMLGLWSLGAFLPNGLPRAAAWQMVAICAVGLQAHVMLIAWRGWRSDLIDSRRNLRAPLVVATTGYMFVQTLCGFGFGERPVLPSLAQALVLAALGVGSALALLRVEPLLVAAAPEAGQSPAPPISPALDLTPADRLVLARLDKAMNENEVWRGEDLSIGTLAALVGAPEHRLRKLINGTLGHRNFADYVNGRRIEAAKIALADPEQALKSVSTIAYELGFASLGPFNRAFRAATGVTPTAWRTEVTPAHPYLRLVETGEGAPKSDKRA